MLRPLTKLIKFVVVDANTYVNLRSCAISVSEVETVNYKWLKFGDLAWCVYSGLPNNTTAIHMDCTPWN